MMNLTPSKSARTVLAGGLIGCALIGFALSLSAPAFAGFIDERKNPEEKAAPSAGHPVSGQPNEVARMRPTDPRQMFARGFGPSWDAPVQASAKDIPLQLALTVLRPASEPVVPISYENASGSTLVSWSEGASRREILLNIARQKRLIFTLSPDRLIVIAANVSSGSEEAASSQTAPEKKRFEVRLQDVRLHVAMQRWAADTGVRLRWDADRHVLISAPMVFEAEDALQAVGMALSTPGIANSAYPLEVCAYPNVPPLLRITRQGEQGKDCTN